MKCPKCFRELDGQDSFCGFCGARIVPTKATAHKKRKIGLKIFLFFFIVAVVSGTALGFCMARGIIDLENIVQQNEFQWTDFSEAEIETQDLQNEETEKEIKTSESKEIIEETKNSDEIN